MQYHWLKQKENNLKEGEFINNQQRKDSSIHIFVMGWAADKDLLVNEGFKGSLLYDMAQRAINNDDNQDCDVLCVYDYHDLNTDDISALLEQTKNYTHIHISAWSFGVWVAEYLLAQDSRIISATAINGTPNPVNAEYGINPRAFMLTVRGLKAGGMDKFTERMCGSNHMAQKYLRNITLRDTQTLSTELSHLGSMFENPITISKTWNWTRVIIGQADKIFPASSQSKYWSEILPNSSIERQEEQEHFIWNMLYQAD